MSVKRANQEVKLTQIRSSSLVTANEQERHRQLLSSHFSLLVSFFFDCAFKILTYPPSGLRRVDG